MGRNIKLLITLSYLRHMSDQNANFALPKCSQGTTPSKKELLPVVFLIL
jgi:hypothetical protein